MSSLQSATIFNPAPQNIFRYDDKLEIKVDLDTTNYYTKAETDVKLNEFLVDASFVPSLEFSGNAVDMSYNVREGSYFKIGDMIMFNIVIELDEKGSSTGVATISGLPYPAKYRTGVNFYYVRNVVNPADADNYTGFIDISGSEIKIIYKQNTSNNNTDAVITNVLIADNTAIRINGVYQAII